MYKLRRITHKFELYVKFEVAKKRAHDSQIVRAKENLKLSHGGCLGLTGVAYTTDLVAEGFFSLGSVLLMKILQLSLDNLDPLSHTCAYLAIARPLVLCHLDDFLAGLMGNCNILIA